LKTLPEIQMPLPNNARLYAVVPAAGTGSRMAASLPKQYLSLFGRTVAEHTLARLLGFAPLEKIVVATAATDLWWPQLGVAHHLRVRSVLGGGTRAHSVLNALTLLQNDAGPDDWVLVHDIARPCLRLSDIEHLIERVGKDGAILAAPLTDTIKRTSQHQQIAETISRETLWRALTPQLFPLMSLQHALTTALAASVVVTDEASAMEYAGFSPLLVQGHADNIKITLPADLPLAGFYLERQRQEGLQWAFV